MENKNCFVIIGYGKKTSYANGKARSLDLDQTYTILIKPVFDALGIPCYRAIDKNVSGSIDKLMLQEIKNADIALADISTLNANVMWELGVRHALKPKHTIMICEKEQMSSIPFDVNSFVIHQYTHSEEGIPYLEVERFRKYLSESVTKMLNEKPPRNDSPVFTFLEDELVNKPLDKNIEKEPENNLLHSSDSFATIMENAEQAKNKNDFNTALELLRTAKQIASQNMALKDNMPYVISRQALCTYKSKKPNELEALVNAKIILDELMPNQTQDVEVLGLSGAICKRLFQLTNDINYLDQAIRAYEKGFQFKQDYYNGINAAFMLYKKASLAKGDKTSNWEDIKLKADYIRNSVLEIATQLESTPGFIDSKDAIWVLLTIAEAYNYKKNEAKLKEYELRAEQLAEKTKDNFAMGSYREQKEKIKEIFQKLD